MHKNRKSWKWLLYTSFISKKYPLTPFFFFFFPVSARFPFRVWLAFLLRPRPSSSMTLVCTSQWQDEVGSDFCNTGWLSLIYILFLPFLSVPLGSLPGSLDHGSSKARGYTRSNNDWLLRTSDTIWAQWFNIFIWHLTANIMGWLTLI